MLQGFRGLWVLGFRVSGFGEVQDNEHPFEG